MSGLNPGILVLGTGAMAAAHVKALKALGVSRIWLLGRNQLNTERRAQDLGVRPLGGPLDRALLESQPTHIIAAVSVENHEDLYEELVLNPLGSTLLLEKPLSLSLGQATKLVTAARTPNQIFVAMNRRFFTSVQEAERVVEIDGKGPRLILVTDQEKTQGAPTSFTTKSRRRFMIMANSIHLIDLVREFARGNVDQIREVWIGPEESQSLWIQFSSGDVCSYHLHWDIPAPWGLSISTKNSYAELSPLEKIVIRKSGLPNRNSYDPPIQESGLKPGLLGQTQAFLNCPAFRSSKLQTITDHLPSVALADSIANYC